MMFLVIFGSLAAVMAVVAQGNLRTAHSHLQVNRAMSAAETGLSLATRRLDAAAQRFVIEKGTITPDLGEKLWKGTWGSGDGQINILPPVGYTETEPATSIVTALRNNHLDEPHALILEPGDELLPSIDQFGKLVVRPIGVSPEDNTPTFRLSYELLADGRFVRVTSTGRDGTVTRTIRQDFEIVKRLDAAMISPSRIMIGKNVHVDGPIGSRYGQNPSDLAIVNGHPIIIRSDFRHLDPELDSRIETFIEALIQYDVAGDNRLRVDHPIESQGLSEPWMVDYTGDGYVSDWDIFLDFFDTNQDGMVVYDSALAFAAGYGNLSEEFTADEQLAALIDSFDPQRGTEGGYKDGVLSALDPYAKVRGQLLFKAKLSDWEDGQGGNFKYQREIQGPIEPEIEQPAIMFDVPDSRLYDLSISDFATSADTFKAIAQSGQTFLQQLTAQLGGDPNTHVWSDHPTSPDYLRVNHPTIAHWEEMPLGSAGFYDWYRRPIYKNMTFVNVKIPKGNNGLFINCIFVGAVHVEIHADNDHVNWNFLGIKEKVGDEYVDKFDYQSWEPVLEINNNPVYDTRPFSNNVRFHDCTFIGSIVSDPADEFAHVRNKIQITGNTFVTLDENEIENGNFGSQQELQEAIQAFLDNKEEFRKSSLLAPNFSVDVGNFSNEPDERIDLMGTIIAGVLDVRGTAEVVGTLLMTYKPVAGQGPLYYGGSPAMFNATIGYFGPGDGDGEGHEPDPSVGFGKIKLRYDPSIPMPDGIMAPIRLVPLAGSYTEGGGS